MIVIQSILAKDNLVNTMRSKYEQITINIQIICEVVIQWLLYLNNFKKYKDDSKIIFITKS